jgi:hypothetical protein
MGIRSTVGLCVKKEHLNDKLRGIIAAALLISEDDVEENEEGAIFVVEGIKWNGLDPEVSEVLSVSEVMSALEAIPDEDYLLIDACYEYPESSGPFGAWFDNPWGMAKVVCVDVEWAPTKKESA